MNKNKPTAGVIMAAGLSTRMGRPKQLLNLKGKPLIEWVLDACLNSRLAKTVLVLGHDYHSIAAALSEKLDNSQILTTINKRYHQGQSQSLRTGLSEVMDEFPSVMFLLGDQPLVDAKMIDLLLTRFWKSGKEICVPVHQGRRGNPSIFSRNFFAQLMRIQGDIGAREIIRANPDRLLSVDVDDPLSFFDIDTEEDLNTLITCLK
ncbi:NTP transferase domain-containing protein [Thermodesulfobacteriota bacterium]